MEILRIHTVASPPALSTKLRQMQTSIPWANVRIGENTYGVAELGAS
jgi:hypothetical protein